MSLQERILLYNRLSLYLRSGIPIRDALGFMRDSAKRGASRRILGDIDDAVLHGTSLAAALGVFSKAFPVFETRLIEIGERSGSLSQNLAYLASLLARRRTLARKIRSALMYPGIIVIGTIGVTAFLLLYAFPKIMPIFRGLQTPLPFATRMLIGMSDGMAAHGWAILTGMLIVVVIAVLLMRHSFVRRHTERIALRLPLLGALTRAYNLALISRTLATLLASGVPLILALTLVGNGVQSGSYRVALLATGERVRDGRRFSSELKEHSWLFPHTFVELVAAGESTGSLSGSLDTAAQVYEEDLDEGTHTLTTLLEPVLMIAMGLLVGGIAMAIISPIYGITQNIVR